MSVQPKVRKSGKVTYYAVFYDADGKQVWEKAGKGTDKREAGRLDDRRQKEVAAGTYVPKGRAETLTVKGWIKTWLQKHASPRSRKVYTPHLDHVLALEWFASKRVTEVRPPDSLQVVRELEQRKSRKGGLLSPKTVHDIFGALHNAFQRAVFEEKITSNPIMVPPGTLTAKSKKREPYEAAEAVAMTEDPRVRADAHVFANIAFYTGARLGEICGLKWKDIQDTLSPLRGIRIVRQYDEQELKTSILRLAPIHPKLLPVLAQWFSRGFSVFYGRAPTRDDYIVPRYDFTPHTTSTGQKLWEAACLASGVAIEGSPQRGRGPHRARHAFISYGRRGGAQSALEEITHRPKGDIITGYTSWGWKAVCDAACCVDYHAALAENIRTDIDGGVEMATFLGVSQGPSLGLSL